jgi:hypothetical protein
MASRARADAILILVACSIAESPGAVNLQFRPEIDRRQTTIPITIKATVTTEAMK